jgi:hypothetical protein
VRVAAQREALADDGALVSVTTLHSLASTLSSARSTRSRRRPGERTSVATMRHSGQPSSGIHRTISRRIRPSRAKNGTPSSAFTGRERSSTPSFCPANSCGNASDT